MRASILITPLAPLLACACLLTGCGQKGPLYLPPETPIRQATPAVTMPAGQDGADEADEADAADETGAAPRKGTDE